MTILFCDNEFCIYQKEGKCVLEGVHLDIQGNCENCIYVSIERETLKDLKQKALGKL